MKNNTYSLVCGMEVHVELKTQSKMFCGCKNDPFHAPKPNIYTCAVCLGMPGALPVANKKAVEWTILLGLALNCKINLYSKFDRKNYFYPDLPKGYQISQYDLPFCYDGFLQTSTGKIRIRRIHLEEDTGKLLHQVIDGKMMSLIDFNRSSVPLVEIVTEPDIISAEQAKEYGKKLQTIIRYLDIANCDMEQGGMRLEANISLRDKKDSELPVYKVEVKNINSFRFLEKAIIYEMVRQEEMLRKGELPRQETRGWNEAENKTVSQRSKENAEEYRYFPDPDLPPIEFIKETIEKMKKTLPELPDEKISRWFDEFRIEERFSKLLIDDKSEAEWYEKLFKEAEKEKVDPIKLAKDIVNGKINIAPLKDDIHVILNQFTSANTTDDFDEKEVNEVISSVLAENGNVVLDYKAGKRQVINFLVAQVIKELNKKVDFKRVLMYVEKRL